MRELAGSFGTQAFNALAYSPPGSAQPRLVASGIGPDGPELIFWDAASGDLLAESPTGGREAGSFRISPIGRLVLQAGYEGVLRFWDLQTGQRITQQYLYACPDSLTGSAFARGGWAAGAPVRRGQRERSFQRHQNTHLFLPAQLLQPG